MEMELSYLNKAHSWTTKEDIDHVIKDLEKVEGKIDVFLLRGNTLGLEAAEALREPLKKQGSIKRAIWSDLFTGRGKQIIGPALKALSMGMMHAQVRLVELDLSDNAFGPNGVVGVTDLIASECCYTLKVLNMNNQGLGHQGCKALVEAMSISRKNSDKKGLNLEVFIAGRNRLENAGMEMLSTVFGDGMCSLKKLVLLQNGIGIHGIKGIQSLVTAIKNHKNLEIFNVSDNTIKSDGMKLLSDVISDMENLKELYMGDCLLKTEGAKLFSLLAEDRTICTDLRILSLSGNEIKGAEALLIVNAMMEGKPNIQKIDLRENEIKKSKLCEIHDLLAEHGKEDLLEKDDENSDEEDDDYESNEESCSDEEGAGDYAEEDDTENDADNKDLSDKSTENSIKNETEESQHISSPYIFGNISKTSSLFTSGITPKNEGLFKTPLATTNSGLFSSPVATPSKPFDLFSSPMSTTSIFSQPTGLFASNTSSSNTTNTTSSLFGNPVKSTNIFSNTSLENKIDSSKTNLFRDTKPFSFSAAASAPKPNILNESILSCLNSDSLMNITKSTLKLSKESTLNTALEAELKKVAVDRPENAVRIGLLLCDEENTFTFGVSLISHLLVSRKWSQATNAVLVEMDCIKSEEKQFIPICKVNPTLPCRVLKKILEVEQLPEEVKVNLGTVLKNFGKKESEETEDLLRKLGQGLKKLSI